ncbi:MAG: L-serine ammonia-lyase [Betaproteobacteria bacterium]|nr:L-serine ammonia-lyase [Betaproteobacteria bacterium]
MTYISTFDLFKIGIGPSSSHTVGPMRAARRFLKEMPAEDLARIDRIEIELYGSLAHTGKGHGTDIAIVLGLAGEVPDETDPAQVGARIASIKAKKRLALLGGREIGFIADEAIQFNLRDLLPIHSNGMHFRAFVAGTQIVERAMYSIGGGFVVDEDEVFVGTPRGEEKTVPHPFNSMRQLLERCAQTGKRMAALLRENEVALHGEAATNAFIDRVVETMFACIDRGLVTDGMLPGGLKVMRRAHGIHDKLQAEKSAASVLPHQVMDWVSVYAIAVNEENAAGGRVVTAPTNGAAGVVPSVLRYARDFCGADAVQLRDFMLVAAAVGALCKMNASISGAEVGCQGEVGSASAMAAAGLASVLLASDAQIENAAEIALEHHLGMTCDPIGGLVQIPCIERNAMGAIKAISATSLSLRGDGIHHVTLDQAIDTMRRTGADMMSKYKETSLGGLAVKIVEC